MDIGAELRAAREAKGLTLATLAQRTRVQPRILEAIELNNLAAIPPKPFGRGFVRSYAQEVDLDPSNVVQNYFAQFPATEPAIAHDAATPSPRSFEWTSQWTGFGTALAILLLLVTAAALRQGGEQRVEPGAVGTSGASKAHVAPPA
ncbi:MAG TPA: helix-turn-helix domain-containing protein, partial [Vicinamibacterales bacterium]|nr:helix-turn-helix domain-containing protein [Vicinamibacterales bacterium]